MPLDPELLRYARENITPHARKLAIEYLDMVKDYTPQWWKEKDHAYAYVLKQVVMYEEKDSPTPEESKRDIPIAFDEKKILNQFNDQAYWFLKKRLYKIAKLCKDKQDVLKLVEECDDILDSVKGDE